MSSRLRFGNYELNVTAHELSRQGRPIKMERIPMQLLVLLLERRPDLVTRDEILSKLWSDRASVDADNAINTAVSKIRTLLRDAAEGTVFISAVPGKGYRFTAPVTVIAEEPIASVERVVNTPPPVQAPSIVSEESTETRGEPTPATEKKLPTWIWLSVAAAALVVGLGAWIARGCGP
jgi:DNA-binding winged helix-turn-helix (wHTH) protein